MKTEHTIDRLNLVAIAGVLKPSLNLELRSCQMCQTKVDSAIQWRPHYRVFAANFPIPLIRSLIRLISSTTNHLPQEVSRSVHEFFLHNPRPQHAAPKLPSPVT